MAAGVNAGEIPVFAPGISLTVTVEAGRDETGSDEVHLHPGGQGFWIARMLKHLGEHPVLLGPIGGESGQVITALAGGWGIDLRPVEIPLDSPVVVQDRRHGERHTVAETNAPTVPRHELDDLYGRMLDLAMSSRLCVLTGQGAEEIVPTDTFRRLGHDLAASGTDVIGDLHGAELDAYLSEGRLAFLKVSEEDLIADGAIDGDDEPSALRAIGELVDRGVGAVILSRSERPVLARIEESTFRATPPTVEPADFRGAGDSMTAGLATAFNRGLGPEATLRLACGAGAANATRHGLGSASTELVTSLAARVEVERMIPDLC